MAPPIDPASTDPTSSTDDFAHLPAALDAGWNQPVADLAHILAHRLRGPLTSIQCYTEMLAETLGTYEEREMALRIIESAAAIEGMLADLQRFSFSITPVLRGLDARRVAEGVLAGLGEQGIRVQLVVEEDGEVAADPVLLQQALLILLHNALDAVRKAGPSAPSVRLTVSRPGAEVVCFDVWNPGSVSEHGQQVFEPFFTTKSQNLGIGLPIARRIAAAHGGQLTLGVCSGEGVTFTLSLPSVTGYNG